VCIPV